MIVHEYRVVLPLSVEEYKLASLYTIAHMSKEETGGSEGVEIVKNEPFINYPLLNGLYSSGQYTFKIYHLEKKMPPLIRLITPKGSKSVHEECWNAYPYTKTVITNPGYMKDNFRLEILSLHNNDRGKEENMLQLSREMLCQREVTLIDIAKDPVAENDYNPNIDPKLFHSEKTGRGPLTNTWMEKTSPVMTCYKVVIVNFKWFGLQRKVEMFIQRFEQRLFTIFHRKLFCLIDEWYGLTTEDIRRIEDETKRVLNEQRMNATLKGTVSFS